MIEREVNDKLRHQLLGILDEDAHNTQRLLARLDALGQESGVGAFSALLSILTRLRFDDEQARAHWEAIVAHREGMVAALGRQTGLRVAVLDYFVNVNRQLTAPALIDLELEPRGESDGIDRRTGLVDGESFRRGVQAELRRARRYTQRASIVLTDLDDFAARTEAGGELVGDRLLREVAILLANSCRDIDVVARLHEDAFAALLPETDRNGALLVAERARLAIERHFAGRRIVSGPVALTLSAGTATYPDDGKTAEELIAAARSALYDAKAGGKNRIQSHRPERRRYLRFELEPGRFEVELLDREGQAASARNLSRSGLSFTSPVAIEVGERLELRLVDGAADGEPLRIRGWVVRLEELPDPLGSGDDGTLEDRYEIGVVFDLDWEAGSTDLLRFLEGVQSTPRAARS